MFSSTSWAFVRPSVPFISSDLVAVVPRSSGAASTDLSATKKEGRDQSERGKDQRGAGIKGGWGSEGGGDQRGVGDQRGQGSKGAGIKGGRGSKGAGIKGGGDRVVVFRFLATLMPAF